MALPQQCQVKRINNKFLIKNIMFSKLFTIITISLIIFLIPLSSQGQGWDLMDDFFFEYAEPEIILKTGSLKLFWSANTYVPYGYQGRKLATTESRVIIDALLEILGENPKNLKYSWFLDGIFQESKSGYGQDKFEFWVKRFAGNSHTVLLKVFNESRSFLTEESITIPIVSPELVIFSKKGDKINLPYNTAIKDFDIISEEETSFLALPFFFDIKTMWDLEFRWVFANEVYKETSLTANIFGLKITNKKVGGSLEQILKVVATNLRRPGQGAEKTIKVNVL